MIPVTVALQALPDPDPIAAAHSVRLLAYIQDEIAKAGGAISFARFMELALYAPGLGYYAVGTPKFGAEGDFVTAPELSPLFGRCFARQCRDILDRLEGGMVLELGAGTGRMAVTLLQELAALHALPDRYAILELSGELRERQQRTIAELAPDLQERVVWLDRIPTEGFCGIVIGNEVLDALPVERFRITPRGPRRLMVVANEDGLAWQEGEEDATVTARVAQVEAAVGWPLPEGYTSEYVPQLQEWLTAVAEPLIAGVILFIDYGYPRRDYYHPERSMGTLLCHYRHRAHDQPLWWPGLQDITASVDFTAVAEAGMAAGLAVAGYTRQNHFLLGCGLLELLQEAATSGVGSLDYLEQARQVKLLTLPGEMGDRFHVIALTRHWEEPLRGFAFRDERQRL